MNPTVTQAMALWGLEGAEADLIAARENAVYRVRTGAQTCAMRLHRQGYRSDAELWSELQWMAASADGGLSVPAPIPAKSGEMLQMVDGVQVDVLSWLEGETLKTTLSDADPARRAALYHQLGQQMAHLHLISDGWAKPTGFQRCAWDRNGLLGEAPLWDRFWDNPALNRAERDLLIAMRAKADAELAQIEDTLDYGLIHADLVATNVMVNGAQMHLIDFDDGGCGFRLFELATALSKMISAPDYDSLRDALIAGYTAERDLDLAALDLMILLRAATYVGWNITRMHDADGTARNPGLIAAACTLAERYMAQG